jgi:adenosylhomocysteine nucleosidase
MPLLGIMTALPEELDATLAVLSSTRAVRAAGRTFSRGCLGSTEVVAVACGIGKVAAAMTAAHLIGSHGADGIVVAGVTGAFDRELRIGDVLLADRVVQHDLDASPLFPAREIPSLRVSVIDADPVLHSRLGRGADRYLRSGGPTLALAPVFAEFGIGSPRVRVGTIASGDRFIATEADRSLVRSRVPDAACVDMESAACAQVCREHGVPMGVLRVVSDRADEHAPMDFARFLSRIAGVMIAGVLSHAMDEQGVAGL